MNWIVIYLVVGLVFGLILENVWEDEDEQLTWEHRLITVFCWPLILIVAIYSLIGGDDNDDFIGLGGAH